MYQSKAGPEIPSVSQAMVFTNCLVGKINEGDAVIGSDEDASSRSWMASLRPAR